MLDVGVRVVTETKALQGSLLGVVLVNHRQLVEELDVARQVYDVADLFQSKSRDNVDVFRLKQEFHQLLASIRLRHQEGRVLKPKVAYSAIDALGGFGHKFAVVLK